MKQVTVAGDIAVTLRRSTRARRLTLRVSRSDGAVVLTMPARMNEAEALQFARSKADWLRRTRAAMPGPQVVAHGVLLPVEGRLLRVMPAAVRAVRAEGDRLLVPQTRLPGPVLAGWLKHLALSRIMPHADRHAAALGRPVRAIRLRDTRSRWGSCTYDGRLMFSWRLAMAPPEVLDYVVAHEVAHLAHLDHSPAFWAAVARLMPDYAPHRLWLRQHGNGLQAWQFRSGGDAD